MWIGKMTPDEEEIFNKTGVRPKRANDPDKPSRNFKGIWVPAEVWLDGNLTPKEKFIIGEIYCLDNGQGCFASNKHFSKFFGISVGAVDNSLRRLKRKKVLINIPLRRGDKDAGIFRRLRVIHRGYHFFKTTPNVAYKPYPKAKKHLSIKTMDT